MGANIAHALAVELARLPDVEQPSALFVGARVAPGTAARSVGPDSTDADLVDWLRRLGGTPEQVLAEPDLLEVLLPTLRADLAVAAGRADGVLPVPIRAFAGRADAEAPTALMCGWSAVTTAAFALDELDGGHFFLADSGRAVLAAIRADLFGAADRPAPLADAR
jgi:surfactin synthase thioesterase subunit